MISIRKIKQAAGSHWHNIAGWRTNKKIVVFESDDWGSIRMPSKEVYNRLLKAGIRVDNCPFSKYDSLASDEDFIALFDVLSKHKDINDNYPILTANSVVANPDFQKIKSSGYKEYHYEFFTETLKKYPSHQNAFTLWKTGMDNNLFYPQLHGREHLNFSRWLKCLNENSKETIFAFENEMFGISTTISNESRRSYMAALDFETENDFIEQSNALKESQVIFENLFGYQSKSFIATNYTWSPKHEKELSSLEIKYLQGGRKQVLPIGEQTSEKNKLHILGEKNKYNQLYLVRNCYFEPSSSPGKDTVSSCLKQMETAFLWKKPAIIGTHRLNFIGAIVEQNRTATLKKFDFLLQKIIKSWPDVEFMTSDKLGEMIEKSKQ